MKKKKESYFTDEELLRLKEVLAKPVFWEDYKKRCEEMNKVFDKMRDIDPKIMNEPMTI